MHNAHSLGRRWIGEFRRNLVYSARLLRGSPAFTLTAVTTLALCIGANTSVFSFVDAVLLRPLPYPEPERLAAVARSLGEDSTSQDGATWELIRDHATFLDAAAHSDWPTGVNLAADGKGQYVEQQRVGAGFFRVLGVGPYIGREFTPEEDRAGGPPATIFSYNLWHRAFNSDPSVVGRTVTLRGEPYTVVGVMPAGFRTSSKADLWTPLRPSQTGEGGGTNYGIVARLKPGVSWAQADSQVEGVGRSAIEKMRRQWNVGPTVRARFRLIPLQSGWTQDLRRALLVLWTAVGAVLLIGCVNVAGLLLARSAGRSREIATRMALGGGRAAIVRQLLTESLLLGVLGGAAGAGLGYLGLLGLKALAQDTFEIWQNVSLDARVLAATAAASLLTSVLFGTLPALTACRLDIRSGLSESGARAIAGAASRWPRRFLVVGEIALGVVLLVGAGLLIRSFEHLRELRPGFDPSNVIAARMPLQDVRYNSADKVNLLFTQALARMRAVPGVESAAVALGVPYERPLNMGFRRIDGPDVDSRGRITNLTYVTPEYFQVLRIRLLRGRAFTDSDTAQSAPVAIVNEAFVREYMKRQDPIGSHLAVMMPGAVTIVGIAEDVQQRPGWGSSAPLGTLPHIYVPASQTDGKFLALVHTWFSPTWIVRARRPASEVLPDIERAVAAVDPLLPFAGFHSMQEVQAESIAPQRLEAALLSALAGLALVLAAIGLYGLIANLVAERTRELGVRMALGATPWQAMRSVILSGLALALAGAALGCFLARYASKLLRAIIWGVTATDALTFVIAAAGLLLVAAIASFIPASRIARIDPAHTLRAD